MVKLSVVISTFNSEKRIEDCLKSAYWASEIIIVDGTSSDKTLDIVKKYTAKIFVKPNHPMLNINKNFGFSKATSDWILSLDADERISPELREEIKQVLLSGDSSLRSPRATFVQNDKEEINGYYVPRKNIIFGKWMRHTGWYPDYQLRLFRKGKGKFEEEHVHEMIKVVGKTEYLKNNIIHYNYETTFQFVDKLINIYGPNEADQMLKKGYQFDWKDAIKIPFKEFLSRFFAREGYKDGFHGLMLSIFMTFYHFVVFAIIWEKQKFKEIDDSALLVDTEKEFAQFSKELSFWFNIKKTKSINNPIKKFTYYLLSKLHLL